MTYSDGTIYANRRRKILERIGNGIAIIPNSPPRQRNSDVFYPYRPDSDFYYLTHFPEPHSVAVLAPGCEAGEYILFCREKNPERERWEGYRTGIDGAVDKYDADISFPITDIDDLMLKLLENRDTVHCCIGRYPHFDSNVIKWMNLARRKTRSGIVTPSAIEDISRTIHELRLFKKKDEFEYLKRAANVSAGAHVQAMKACKPGMTEYEIQATVEYCFKNNACRKAYPSIVASGANACVLHYIDNSGPLKDGDLLLIDAGAEYDCYAADITRTFPINGKFSSPQKALYEIVLQAQKNAIEAAIPGNRYCDVENAALATIVEGLIDLDILEMNADEAIETKAYRPYYMHKIGHWLGLDVHDVGEYQDSGGSRLLEPGMYMTVEPGIYIDSAEDVDKKWREIGIRIEDDVLLTEDGNTVMTSGVPKAVSDIERIMSD